MKAAPRPQAKRTAPKGCDTQGELFLPPATPGEQRATATELGAASVRQGELPTSATEAGARHQGVAVPAYQTPAKANPEHLDVEVAEQQPAIGHIAEAEAKSPTVLASPPVQQDKKAHYLGACHLGRRCYKCGRDLAIQPAIEGRHGLLCFTCRYALDEAGGEQFITDNALYQTKQAEWQAKYGTQWESQRAARQETARKVERCSSWMLRVSGFGVLFLILVCAVLQTKSEAGAAVRFLVVGGCVIWALGFLVGLFGESLCDALVGRDGCPSPPAEPVRDERALRSHPELVFDANPEADLSAEFVNFKPGYPPDWSERSRRCRQRDGYGCRLCGGRDDLRTHHVKPISFGGGHTLQNLITLCAGCHEKQQYYEHEQLVQRNREENRRYMVEGFTRSDGTVIAPYWRRVGRRWRRRLRSA